jgi:hypothetical protein
MHCRFRVDEISCGTRRPASFGSPARSVGQRLLSGVCSCISTAAAGGEMKSKAAYRVLPVSQVEGLAIVALCRHA